MDYKYLTVAKDSGELSSCVKIYPKPSTDQSVSKKVGFKLSYRRRKDELIIFISQISNKSITKGDQSRSGKF